MSQERRRSRVLAGIGASVLGLSVAGVAGLVTAAPAFAGSISVSPTGSFVVDLRGNGHGHGLSQYGARGAAAAGKSYQQILAFYYPGATLARVTPLPHIRVALSGTGATVTVGAAPHTVVTDVPGELPTAGVSKYRLIAGPNDGLRLQKLPSPRGSAWVTVKSGLPDGAEFHRTDWGVTRLYLPGGSSTAYYGYLRALRAQPTGSEGGVSTVDVISWDRYTAGVVPREMPASWDAAAVDAQAVAARTYGAYAVAHPMAADYDICDSSQCQVFGGHAHYDASGHLLWSDDLAAATATSDRVLEYRGAAIFSQFSASNGGWTVSGGQPYLTAQSDPYDAPASGDPYIGYTKTVSVKSVAAFFGLAKVTKLIVSSRDGNGVWGGRVLAGSVIGTDASGTPRTVTASGFDFQAAFGIGTTWFRMREPA